MQSLKQASLLVFCAAIGSLALIGCRGGALDGLWLSSPLVIDGDFDDWEVYPRVVFEKYSTSVSLVNSDDTVYVLVLQKLDGKAGMPGVNFWVNENGKHKKTMKLQYRGEQLGRDGNDRGGRPDGGPGGQGGPGGDRPFGGNMAPGDTSKPRFQMPEGDNVWNMIVCQYAGSGQPDLLAADGSDGPRAACARLENDRIAYELAIPLNRNPNHFCLDVAPGEKLSVGLELTATGSGDREGGPGGGGPGGGPGGGGPGGGGPPGGGMGGGGMGGGGMGGRGGPGGGGPGGGPGSSPGGGQRQSKVEWLDVFLATNPALVD